MSQLDIRIGTLSPGEKGVEYLKQILPHGFESFQINFWETFGSTDLSELGKAMVDACGEQAVISSIGLFGNPLENADQAESFGKCIEAAKYFNCSLVAGFAGALQDRPVDQSMPKFKEVWGELASRAEDNGVRIAFENCNMSGYWEHPLFNIAHSPTAWEMMFNEVTSPAIGLEWEPCHQLNSLIDPLPQLRKWLPKIFHVHGKDATVAWDVVKEYGTRGGKEYVWHRTPGFGDTNWTDVISILRMGGYTGSIDIEGWHDPVYKDKLEMTGQVYALNYLKQCRGGAFVPNPVG